MPGAASATSRRHEIADNKPVRFPRGLRQIERCAQFAGEMHPQALPRPQAALTELRNLLTSSLRRLESPDSDCAADSTCDEAEPVSLAPR